MSDGVADPAVNQGLVDGADPALVGLAEAGGEPVDEKDRFQRQMDRKHAKLKVAEENLAEAMDKISDMHSRMTKMEADASVAKETANSPRTISTMSDAELESLYVNAGQQTKADDFGNQVPLSPEKRAEYDRYRLQASQELSRRAAQNEVSTLRTEGERRTEQTASKAEVSRQIAEDFGHDSTLEDSQLTLEAMRQYAIFELKHGKGIGDKHPNYIYMSFLEAHRKLNGGIGLQQKVDSLQRETRRTVMQNSLGVSSVGSPDAGGPSVKQLLNQGTKKGRKAAVKSVMQRILDR